MPESSSAQAAITRSIAEFAVSTRIDDIPEKVCDRAKLSIFDTLGIAIGGMKEAAPRILAAHVQSLGVTGPCSAIGQGFTCDAAHAALINGVSADIVGWSDISVTQMTHPSVSIAPAAWAVGEQVGASGSDVLAAHIVGTEAANKIGAGIRPGFQLRGWHPLAILNTFGAAVAAGRLLDLDCVQMQHALGIAAGEASGMRVAMGTMSKAYGAGRSARDGVRSAILASKGFTGPPEVIEARDGFLQTFGDGATGAGILEHLGNPFEFDSPGITLKKFPACTRSHNAIQALLDLRASHQFNAADVLHIDCLVTPAVVDYLKYPRPRNALEAKYSMQYCLAATLLDGKLTVASFDDARLEDPALLALMSRIDMRIWDEYAKHGYNPAHAPYGCRLTIHLQNGTTLDRQADRGPWEPDNPPSWKDVEDKFLGNTEYAMSQQASHDVVTAFRHFENVPDIRSVMNLLP